MGFGVWVEITVTSFYCCLSSTTLSGFPPPFYQTTFWICLTFCRWDFQPTLRCSCHCQPLGYVSCTPFSPANSSQLTSSELSINGFHHLLSSDVNSSLAATFLIKYRIFVTSSWLVTLTTLTLPYWRDSNPLFSLMWLGIDFQGLSFFSWTSSYSAGSLLAVLRSKVSNLSFAKSADILCEWSRNFDMRYCCWPRRSEPRCINVGNASHLLNRTVRNSHF